MEAEKMLKVVLDEQLTREIEKIPSEEDIGKKHIFEDSFLTYMAQLMARKQRENCKKRWFTNNSFVKMAACLVCLVGIGTLLFTAFPSMFADLSNKNSSKQESAMDSASIEETAPKGDAANGAALEGEGNSLTDNGKTGSTEESALTQDGGTEEIFTLQSQTFDGEYHIKTVLRNTTAQDITYTPVYGWSYTRDGNTTGSTTDMDIKAVTKPLKSGETLVESYDLKDYGIEKGGGTLELTRQINEQEVVLTLVLEE